MLNEVKHLFAIDPSLTLRMTREAFRMTGEHSGGHGKHSSKMVSRSGRIKNGKKTKKKKNLQLFYGKTTRTIERYANFGE